MRGVERDKRKTENLLDFPILLLAFLPDNSEKLEKNKREFGSLSTILVPLRKDDQVNFLESL